MSEQTAITTNTQRSIFAYSDSDVRAARALKMMLPYGAKLTDDNAMALLLYGKLHDLDPLNGECYFLVRDYTNKSGEKVREELGCYPGVKGKRKKARQQIGKQQGSYKIEYATMNDVKPLGLDAQQVAVCIRAELRDTITSGQYIIDTIKLKHEGFDQAFIESVVGKPPVVVGYGVVKTSELGYIKMAPAQLARKRAETDCLTQRFDLPFAEDADTASGIDYVDADYVPEDVKALPENGSVAMPRPGAEPRSEQMILSELGFSGQQ